MSYACPAAPLASSGAEASAVGLRRRLCCSFVSCVAPSATTATALLVSDERSVEACLVFVRKHTEYFSCTCSSYAAFFDPLFIYLLLLRLVLAVLLSWGGFLRSSFCVLCSVHGSVVTRPRFFLTPLTRLEIGEGNTPASRILVSP